ncbi:unnamed protein product [Choristocarpus tenellus]|uniref:30S ribosomal protein S13 n=1 Tax=Choristocarpus tenellus TaxID=116065 RepID=UPI002E77F71D|nr:30S ribosomal protein S13 [Choristocarpus tenellus]WAM62314.1 30S ribosomal protein S13 [Choristocarpus tenellus]
MVRFLGVNLANNKKIKYALTAIYGIGLSRSTEILKKTKLDNIEELRTKNLSDNQISIIRKILENDYQLEGDLLRLTNLNIKRLMENSCIKGRRHRLGLPVRGQRTRTNARTRRGLKKTMVGKK